MSTQPTLAIQQTVDSSLETRPDSSLKRELCIDALRAASWIACLEELLSSGEPRSAASQFYDELSDACWLARWKRENVVVDIETSATPELLSQLVPTNAMTEAKILEDILSTLSESPFDNHAR